MYKIKYKDCEWCLKYINAKEDLIEYKCLCCNKTYQKRFDENLKKIFANTYKFSNHDINKFILLLQKYAYLNDYMCDWEKFNETPFPENENFHSHLKMEDITDTDYMHAKGVCKDFEIKDLGGYHNVYV